MAIFRAGMKAEYYKPFWNNYPQGTIVTLVKRHPYSRGHYWTIKEGSAGVGEEEIKSTKVNWRERICDSK